MSTKSNKLLTPQTVLAASAGVGILLIVARYQRSIRKTILNWFQKDLAKRYDIRVLNNHDEEYFEVIRTLQRHCESCPVLGIDCEWVTAQGSRNNVALLQLATYKGLCALFRLCNLKQISPELRKVLENDRILKVGVVPQNDANNLDKDFGVNVASTLDLRYLAFEANVKPEGLAKMSKNLLGIELDKHWKIRCSNWEAGTLSSQQVDYAAKDAIVAIELFKTLTHRIEPQQFWETDKTYLERAVRNYQKYAERWYKEMSVGKTTIPVVGCTQGKSMKSHQMFKRFKSSVRQKPLYDNCIMEAPDGEILCTCEKSKARWYVAKGLATQVSEDPFVIRLNFEPSGRAVGEVGKYYTIAKENHCVVCKSQDGFIRKNVVPREYRKHFPEVMKNHTSHDVLLLCTTCHQSSNIADLSLRIKLADLCDATFQSQKNTRLVEEPRLKKIKSIARALLYKAKQLPEERKTVLENEFLSFFPEGTEITESLLVDHVDIDIYSENNDFIQHGQKVVNYFIQNGGIIELEKMWREHFVNSMRPKYLPDLWSVSHNEHRLEIRAEEGRVEEADLIVAGVRPNGELNA